MDASAHGLVRRWLLIGYFLIHILLPSARLQAETKAQQGELQAAASYYERALQLSPDSLELFRGYITVLRTDGKDAQVSDGWGHDMHCRHPPVLG